MCFYWWFGPTSTYVWTEGTNLNESEEQRLKELTEKDRGTITTDESSELSCLHVRKHGYVTEWRHWHYLPKPSMTPEELQRFIDTTLGKKTNR